MLAADGMRMDDETRCLERALGATFSTPWCLLLLGVQRMFGFFVKLILQSEALLIGFDGLNGFHDGLNPVVHFELTEFARGDRTISGVVIRETRVPPDSSVKILR